MIKFDVISIDLVKATKPYKPDNGDLILDWIKPSAKAYLESPLKKKDDKKKNQILPLRLLDPNPWEALKMAAIKTDEIMAPYKCPYTGYEFFAIIPTAIISSDLEKKYKHVHHWNKDYLFDYEYHRETFKEDITTMGEIGKLMFGSGWTTMTGINDGSRGRITTTVDLNNGDKLFVYTWERFNK